jgi:hypothetical protein
MGETVNDIRCNAVDYGRSQFKDLDSAFESFFIGPCKLRLADELLMTSAS